MRSHRTRSTLAARLILLVIALGTMIGSPSGQGAGAETTWSLAAVGDSIITRRISVFDDPAFLNLVKVIRDADAAFNNLEITLFRLSEFEGSPQAESGGTWIHGSPEVAEELKWAGFDLFNRANNHTTDFGVEGMLETTRILDALGLVHAGVGSTLGEASQAKYLETRKGRLALIGLATTFTTMSRASDPRLGMNGRPGLNPLRVDRVYQLDAARMADLRRVAAALGIAVPDKEAERLRFGGATFRAGPENKIVETINRIDEDRILRSIRNASRQADFVIVTSHSHEPSNDATEPPAWLVAFAKKSIDAGADTYIVHGPHQLRAIEVYRNKPIFYSLGNFIFQNETAEPQPPDMFEPYGLDAAALSADAFDARSKGGTIGFPANPIWWESVVAVPVFRGHQLAELKLYPIDLGHRGPRSQRGTPRLAGAELGRKIVERLSALSAPFGTRIVWQGGMGVWQMSTGSNSNR